MLRRRAELMGAAFYVVDLSLLVCSAIAAYNLRGWIDPYFNLWADYAPLFGLLVALWSLLLYWVKAYEFPRGRTLATDVVDVLKVSVIGFFVAAAVVFGLKLHFVSRLVLGAFTILTVPSLLVGRSVLRFVLARTTAPDRRIVVIGNGSRAEEIRRTIEGESHWGVQVADVAAMPTLVAGTPMGIAAALSEVLSSTVVDDVIFALKPSQMGQVAPSLLVCERLGVTAHISLDLAEMKIAKGLANELAGIPMLTYTTVPHDERLLFVKRVLDVVISGSLLMFLAPLMAVIAVAVKVTSPGPILFRQVRSGANGRRFVMYKFRSMVAQAEALQASLAGANEMSGPVFKIRNDPRLTTVGALLRRTSLDELPQLWNVLKGEMSIVGPRPPVPSEVARYEAWQRRRLSMKPGLTCLWQVSGRSTISDFDEWMRLDLEYIDRWSVGLDLRILARTIPAVISGRGAA